MTQQDRLHSSVMRRITIRRQSGGDLCAFLGYVAVDPGIDLTLGEITGRWRTWLVVESGDSGALHRVRDDGLGDLR
jgi:hypothetical protein